MNSHPEADVEAAFIYNFTKFIEWSEPPSKNSEVVIGYWGKDGIMTALKKLDGRLSLKRRIKVVRVSNIKDIERVDVLVLQRDVSLDKETINLVREKHILTIAEGRDALEKGVIFSLFKEGNKIRFGVNLKNAARSGIKISSRLLKLARYVVK